MTQVQIMPGGEGGGYVATVDGIRIPIAAYVADPGDHDKVMVSLVVAADALSVGIPPARRDEQTRTNLPPRSTWGDGKQPDPRVNMPGWQPPTAAVDAHRGRSGEHRLIGDGFVSALRKLVRVSGWRTA